MPPFWRPMSNESRCWTLCSQPLLTLQAAIIGDRLPISFCPRHKSSCSESPRVQILKVFGDKRCSNTTGWDVELSDSKSLFQITLAFSTESANHPSKTAPQIHPDSFFELLMLTSFVTRLWNCPDDGLPWGHCQEQSSGETSSHAKDMKRITKSWASLFPHRLLS